MENYSLAPRNGCNNTVAQEEADILSTAPIDPDRAPALSSYPWGWLT
jgi:hypothetical protein